MIVTWQMGPCVIVNVASKAGKQAFAVFIYGHAIDSRDETHLNERSQ